MLYLGTVRLQQTALMQYSLLQFPSLVATSDYVVPGYSKTATDCLDSVLSIVQVPTLIVYTAAAVPGHGEVAGELLYFVLLTARSPLI
jgi:hypothetical protein